MQPTTQPTGTIANPSVRTYLRLATRAHDSAKALHALFMRPKESAETDAIWDGYWALENEAKRCIAALRDAGGLLFWGSAAAIASAHQPLEAA